jgi:23S rRNA (cytosine1962-C5)-methyltransferase
MSQDKAVVNLNRYEIRRIRSGHPWVYPKSIDSIPDSVQTGDEVSVVGPRGEKLGTALYHKDSKIRLRIISREGEDIDLGFFVKRLKAARAYRNSSMASRSAFRLINSESDGMSGLVIDCYGPATLFQITSAGMERRKATIIEAIEKVLDPAILIERNDVSNRVYEGLEQELKIHKSTVSEAELKAFKLEIAGTRYELNLIEGNKTGLYLDQIDNHERFLRILGRYEDARVLDCFTYVGGFAITAAKSDKITSVTALDQSQDSLDKALLNSKLNGVDSKCTWIQCNVFDWLREKATSPTPEDLYDIIVLDPPSFTKNRHTVEGALRGYKELHLRALRLLKPGGLLFTYSCSHHISEDMLRSLAFEAAMDGGHDIVEQEAFRQSLDHPVVPAIPETYYLKGFSYYKRSDSHT